MVRILRSQFEDFSDFVLHSLKRLPKSYFSHCNLDNTRNFLSKDYRNAISLEDDEDMFDFNQQVLLDSILHHSPERNRRQYSEPLITKYHPSSRRSLLDPSDVTVIPIIFEKSPSFIDKNKANNGKTTSHRARSASAVVIDRDETDSPILIDDEPFLSPRFNISNKNNTHRSSTTAIDCLQSPIIVDDLSPHQLDIGSNKLSPSVSFKDNKMLLSSNLSKLSNNSDINSCDMPSVEGAESNSVNIEGLSNSLSGSKYSKIVDDFRSSKNFVEPAPNYPIYDILKNQLAKEERLVNYVRGDGNCFFRALSKLMYGTDTYHKAVRNLIVDIIATNKDKFAQFVDGEDVQNHVERMSEDHCWATTCEIYAAATLLQRDVYMYTPNHSNEQYSWLLFRPVFKRQLQDTELNSRPCCYITLCNTNGNHYDIVVPNHGSCNCFLPHPQLDGICASVDLTE